MSVINQPQGVQIGEILLQQGVLTERQIQHILTIQKASHRPFGDLAERLYSIDSKVIEDAWVEQYLRVAGKIDLDEQDFDEQCLRLLNRRQAWQFHLLPINKDFGGETSHINMATDAKNLVRAVNFSSRRIDDLVFMHIADRGQLREFLMKHYPVPQYLAQFSEEL